MRASNAPAEYGDPLDARQRHSQMEDFADWHQNISQRERELEFRHTLNVFAAHNQVAKHRYTDPNRNPPHGPELDEP